MSLFDDLAGLFINSAGSQHTPTDEYYHGEKGRIDRLCRQLGWSVNERDGESIRLHFNDPLIGMRRWNNN